MLGSSLHRQEEITHCLFYRNVMTNLNWFGVNGLKDLLFALPLFSPSGSSCKQAFNKAIVNKKIASNNDISGIAFFCSKTKTKEKSS